MPASVLYQQKSGPTAPAEAPPPTASAGSTKIAPASVSKTPPPPDPQTLARTHELVTAASKLYYSGAYDKAESALKEAMALYPFLADANLMLGKIFLLKGSATRDVSLINSARLMFEMAHTVDPTLREAEVLLDLFRHDPTE